MIYLRQKQQMLIYSMGDGDIIEMDISNYIRKTRFISLQNQSEFTSPSHKYLKTNSKGSILYILREDRGDSSLEARGIKGEFYSTIELFGSKLMDFEPLNDKLVSTINSEGIIQLYQMVNLKSPQSIDSLDLSLLEDEVPIKLTISEDRKFLFVDTAIVKKDIPPFSSRMIIISIQEKKIYLAYTFSYSDTTAIDMETPFIFTTLFSRTVTKGSNSYYINMMIRDSTQPEFFFLKFDGTQLQSLSTNVNTINSHVLIDFELRNNQLLLVDARNSFHMLNLNFQNLGLN